MNVHHEVPCICGAKVELYFVGNINADAKGKCECGRNITMHFRGVPGKVKRVKPLEREIDFLKRLLDKKLRQRSQSSDGQL